MAGERSEEQGERSTIKESEGRREMLGKEGKWYRGKVPDLSGDIRVGIRSKETRNKCHSCVAASEEKLSHSAMTSVPAGPVAALTYRRAAPLEAAPHIQKGRLLWSSKP